MGMRERLGVVLSKVTTWYQPEILMRMPLADRDRNGDRNPRVCLTFDDGPTAEGTEPLLEVLGKHDVPAAFFLCGAAAESHPDLVKAMHAAGHVIGNHSYSHCDAWKTDESDLVQDWNRSRDVLGSLIGEPLRWMRPPFGKVSKALMRWSRANQETILLWDIMPGDFQANTGVERIARRIAKPVQDGSVVCLHDNATSLNVTPAALAEALPRMIDAGCEFTVEPLRGVRSS